MQDYKINEESERKAPVRVPHIHYCEVHGPTDVADNHCKRAILTPKIAYMNNTIAEHEEASSCEQCNEVICNRAD